MNKFLLVSLSVGIGLISGCGNTKNHMVIASTATNIGLELSENPASSTPQAKLGYNRAEVAIVPTNRSTNKEPKEGSLNDGAADSVDVLMELRYSAIFSENSGIYQRLAVGSTAVQQPGASFMMAKGSDGKVDPALAGQVAAAHEAVAGIPTADRVNESTKATLRKWYQLCTGKPTELAKFENAAKAQGYTNFAAFVADLKTSKSKVESIEASLATQNTDSCE